ncbi:MAG: hypothetical protein ABFD04_16220 [Syntrophomonas sp.]
MFISFLNKSAPQSLDLSVLTAYRPEQVIFYFFSDDLSITLDNYLRLKELLSDDELSPFASLWVALINDILKAEDDLQLLANNEYLDFIGPYYYSAANVRFYFGKTPPGPAETLTIQDMGQLEQLQEIATPEPSVQTYGRNKKGARRFSRNKDEILRDVRMCLISISEIEKLHKKINFWEKVYQRRLYFIEEPDLLPVEPDQAPVKPDKPGADVKGKLLLFTRQRSGSQRSKNIYQHQLKIYYIRYREYEKACDRFKAILEKWPELKTDFFKHCGQDLDLAAERLLTARQHMELYEAIIAKSMVHQDYQDVKTLTTFQSYLDTGRANDLQECMNLFEEECLWNELKAGQTRIENTIYLLQNDNDHLHQAQAHIEDYLEQKEEDSQLTSV